MHWGIAGPKFLFVGQFKRLQLLHLQLEQKVFCPTALMRIIMSQSRLVPLTPAVLNSFSLAGSICVWN